MSKENEEVKKYIRNVSNNILCAMGKKGWTYQKTADFCGVCFQTIQNIVYGRQNEIKLLTLVKLSEGLEIPIQDILVEPIKREEQVS